MPTHDKTSEKSVYLDREEHLHKGTVGGKIVVPYYYDADTDGLTPAADSDRALAVRIDDATTANITYIGKATIGSATSSAVWQIQRLDESSGLVKTWADSNASFDNVWDDRASLSYA
jgi:hypothetical protein